MTIDFLRFSLISKFGFTKKSRKLAESDVRYCSSFVKDGLWGNKEELRTYRKIGSRFIAKSYFLLFGNFLLFQKRVIGEPIWFDDVKSLLKKLPQDQYDIIFTRDFDIHSFCNGDWIKTKEGIVICDYGGKGFGNTALYDFLIHNNNNLERILKAQ